MAVMESQSSWFQPKISSDPIIIKRCSMLSTPKVITNDRLRLRLCCWHDSDIGESTIQNTKLGQSFSEKNLEPDWTLETVPPSGRYDLRNVVPISV